MSSKRSVKIIFECSAPVVCIFAVAAVIVLLLDCSGFSESVKRYCSVPGAVYSASPFNYRSIADYLRLFTHVIGNDNAAVCLADISFLLLLGPVIEQRYGSVLFLLMTLLCALAAGVVNVCFLPQPLSGLSCVVWMLCILAAVFAASAEKSIQLPFLLFLLLFIGREIACSVIGGNFSCIPSAAGGFAGSVLHFASSPKSPAPARKNSRSAAP